MQQQGKLKNRKPFLQTKAQKNDKFDKYNGESWTTKQHGRDSFRTKKANFPSVEIFRYSKIFKKQTKKIDKNSKLQYY